MWQVYTADTAGRGSKKYVLDNRSIDTINVYRQSLTSDDQVLAERAPRSEVKTGPARKTEEFWKPEATEKRKNRIMEEQKNGKVDNGRICETTP